MFRLYIWLKNYGLFPSPGGFLTQSAKFIRAVEWMDLVAQRWNAKINDENKAKETLLKNAGRLHGR